MFGKEKSTKKSARDIDRKRESELKKDTVKKKEVKEKRQVKHTTIQTLPYECFVSNYIMLLKSNVKIGRETVNLYSKTYLVPDVNYSALTREQQLEKMQIYIDLLNGFDSTVSFQMTLLNSKINKEDFENRLLLKNKKDGLDSERQEFNEILHDKIMHGQNGIQCRKFITVTVSAINFETASTRFFNVESHMINCLSRLGTELITLNANDRVRLIADILRDVDSKIYPVSREEFSRRSEKMLCCPDYFEFKKDYFMYNDTYARCIYFKRLPQSVMDTIFKDIIEMNQSLIISKNVEFVEQSEALTILHRKITDMKQEEITKVKKAAAASRGAFVDPIEGTQLAVDKVQAQEFLEDLQERNQKMTLCQFIVMLTAESFDELQKNTEALEIILRKYQIEPMNAPYRQEQAFSSVLPLGNSFSCDKEHNIQTRRTMSSESTAVFMPFNARELLHENGLFYGQNKLTKSVIMFDRKRLKNPNGFIFGVPGSGKSFLAKLEMIFSILSTDDEILIVDPEREYTALAELLGGEVIYISENSQTHINPMDLTENPDKDDKEYNPIKAKLDFMLSFFSSILGNQEITPIQKTIIDNVMHATYKNYEKPTLKEYYIELEKYEEKAADETKSAVAYLRQTLHLYVHGSMNVFSNPSNVNINKRIVVYDIKELGKNLQTLGMMIVLENLWDRVAKNRTKGVGTRIYIDEMYLLFKSEQSANFFYELYKRARKWGGIPTGITQNVDDLLRSELARTMLSNTQFVVMLSQNSTDRDQLSRLLNISPETMMYVTNASSGSGLIYADEVALMPKSFVEQALARCSVTGSKLWFNCNPDSSEHWFFKEWVDENSEKTSNKNRLHLHFTMDDNFSLSDEVKQRYERMYSGVFYDRYIRGLWVLAEGLVYPMFDKSRHIVRNYTPSNQALYYISCDYGTLNPFSMGLWALENDCAVRLKEYYYDGRKKSIQKTDEEYYSELEKLADGYQIQHVIVDPSAASFITTIKRHGKFRIRKADNSVIDGIRNTMTLIENDRILICECCKDIIREFSLYRWDDKKSREKDTVIKENDHAMDDMRYFVNTAMGRVLKEFHRKGGRE